MLDTISRRYQGNSNVFPKYLYYPVQYPFPKNREIDPAQKSYHFIQRAGRQRFRPEEATISSHALEVDHFVLSKLPFRPFNIRQICPPPQFLFIFFLLRVVTAKDSIRINGLPALLGCSHLLCHIHHRIIT